MLVNMEEEEKQRMEDFVRDLFSKTEDFNLLTKKIVRKKYLQHSKKDSLNSQEKTIFADIIVRLLFEFNVGSEESVKRKEKKPITSPAVQEEKSEVPEDGKGNSPDELSKSAQETRPQRLLLSKMDSCPNVENETSLDACATVTIELDDEEEEEDKKDVKSLEKKSELSENARKLVIHDTKDKKRSSFSLQPTKRVLSRQILINNFWDKVKKTSPRKFILNKHSPVANALSVTTISKHPLTGGSQKLTNDKDINEEAQGEATSFNDQSAAKRQKAIAKRQKAISKRLSAFEVLQSVLEDSNDGSVLSKSDFTDDDRASATRSSPVCDSLVDKEESLIPLEEISDSTPTRRRPLASKRLLESDNESTEGFTPPTKIKRIISSDSDCKNSPIRMRLFRNRIVDYSLRVPNTTEKRKYVIESDTESQSPVKSLRSSDLSTGDSSPVLPLRVKGSSRQKNKGSKYGNCTKADESKERKIVKPFRISISKREVLKASDSESDIESSPVIKEKKTKPKCKKKSSKHKTNNNHLAFSSSSCDTDDVKLSQLKSMNQEKQDNSSDSDGELLINYTSSKFRDQSNNFKVPTVQKNSIAVDGLQPKLKIIHEKSAMDSDSDYTAKKLKSSPLNSSTVGKLRIIRENAVNSENDCTTSINMHICDTAQFSSPDKTPQKVRRKFKPPCAQVLNSDSDSDLGLRIMLSTSSDSEDVPLSKKRKESQTSLQSVSKSLGKFASGGEQEIAVGNENCSQKVSSANSPLSSSEFVDISWTAEDTNSINAAVAYIKNIKDTKVSRQQYRQESTTNESSHVDVEDSSDESDNISYKSNKNKNAVYSEDDEHFVKNWKSKRLVIRLDRIQATSSMLFKPDPSNENLIFTTSSCRTTTSDDNADETSHPEVDCNGISSDSDISSLSDSTLNDCQAPSLTNHAAGEKAESKNVPAESDKLKHLKKICRAAELFVNYKKVFQDVESDSAKCQRLQQILQDAGMKGRPTFKAAERIRLLREAKELNEENIISCDSGRPRRKTPSLFTVKTSKNVIDSKPEKFVNLVGIVDSERSESDMEFN